MTRMTPMAAAARCDPFFAGGRNRDRNAEVGLAAATCESVTKQPDTAMNAEKLQPPR
jgi:hypothetical protein